MASCWTPPIPVPVGDSRSPLPPCPCPPPFHAFPFGVGPSPPPIPLPVFNFVVVSILLHFENVTIKCNGAVRVRWMKFEVDTGEFGTFANLVDSCVDDQSVVEIDEDGLVVDQNNPQNTAFLRGVLPESFFVEWDVDEELTMGVKWSRVSDVLGKFESNNVTVELTERNRWRFSNDEGAEFDMALVDPSSIDRAEIPDLNETSVEFQCTAGNIRDAKGMTDLVSNVATLTIDQDEEKVILEARGDTDNTRSPVTDIVEYPSSNPSASYNMEMLDYFLRNVQKSMVLDVSYGDDYPILLEGELLGSADLAYAVAPRK